MVPGKEFSFHPLVKDIGADVRYGCFYKLQYNLLKLTFTYTCWKSTFVTLVFLIF